MSTPNQVTQYMPTRRQMQLLALDHLEEMRSILVCDYRCSVYHARQGPTQIHGDRDLNAVELEALGIRKLQDIDVDEMAPFDPEPLFFQPWSSDETVDFPTLARQAMGDHEYTHRSGWKAACSESSCTGWCDDYHVESSRRIRWFTETVSPYICRDAGLVLQTEWHLRP